MLGREKAKHPLPVQRVVVYLLALSRASVFNVTPIMSLWASRVSRQSGDDFYIDLLFYNLNLRCYVVIELKTGEFKPEYAGRLNFYLPAVDGLLKQKQDNPSVGLLLCKSKNDLVAEYSLKDMSKPIGVSAYQVTSKLPEELEKQLPSVEDIQKRIK